jgi:hypothetical protein
VLEREEADDDHEQELVGAQHVAHAAEQLHDATKREQLVERGARTGERVRDADLERLEVEPPVRVARLGPEREELAEAVVRETEQAVDDADDVDAAAERAQRAPERRLGGGGGESGPSSLRRSGLRSEESECAGRRRTT